MPTQNALVIFIKNPVAGRVKTRLAATLGNEKALAIYHSLLECARQTALQVHADRLVFYSDYIEEHDAWLTPYFQKRQQAGDDLGRRMHHALEEALTTHDKAVLVGSDIPTLTPAIIETAFAALDEASVVFGPAADGGYYLVGLRQAQAGIFEGISWSTPHVLDDTLARCRHAGLDYRLVDTLQDVDTEADWRRAAAVLDWST